MTPVGGDFEFDHVKRRAGGDDGVVEGGGDEAALLGDMIGIAEAARDSGGEDGCFERGAGADGELEGEEVVEVLVELFWGEAGEEAEAAEVDAEEGNLPASQAAGGGEEGSIAAEDEDDVGLRGDLGVLVGEVYANDVAGFFDARDDLIESGGDAGFGFVGNDEDSHWDGILPGPPAQEKSAGETRFPC